LKKIEGPVVKVVESESVEGSVREEKKDDS
jgi:hypothetical protein